MTRWIEVGAVDDVEVEDVIPFDHDGSDYAIYRAPDGRFHATDGHCSHEQVLLCEGLVIDHVIECPKHNGRFDYTTGAALSAPARIDLRSYPTRVTDGRIWLGLATSPAEPDGRPIDLDE